MVRDRNQWKFFMGKSCRWSFLMSIASNGFVCRKVSKSPFRWNLEWHFDFSAPKVIWLSLIRKSSKLLRLTSEGWELSPKTFKSWMREVPDVEIDLSSVGGFIQIKRISFAKHCWWSHHNFCFVWLATRSCQEKKKFSFMWLKVLYAKRTSTKNLFSSFFHNDSDEKSFCWLSTKLRLLHVLRKLRSHHNLIKTLSDNFFQVRSASSRCFHVKSWL